MLDLVLRNAVLPDGRSGMTIACEGGRIVSVSRDAVAEARRIIDAAGGLVSPPFVDAHFHMDSTLTYGRPRVNRSGTLLEGIELWGELKPSLTHDEIRERALELCRWAVARGTLAIRSHVDVCDPSLRAVKALLEVRELVKGEIDLQLVAFPQDGFLRSAVGETGLTKALDLGVDVVGGIPHFERTMADGAASVERLCRIAAERGLLVDMHCDETDDPLSRNVEVLAREAIRHRLQGRVVGSHLTAMHSMDNYYVSKLIPLMHEAEMTAVANPLINITLQGRHDVYPKRRGMTRVKELLAAGVNVACGHDCVMDPWYPLGSHDMLDVAHMGLHVGHMTGDAEMRAIFDCVTVNAARALHLDGYGLEPGCWADMVLLQAESAIDAIRLRPARLAVIRRGRVIAETPRAVPTVQLAGKTSAVTFHMRQRSLLYIACQRCELRSQVCKANARTRAQIRIGFLLRNVPARSLVSPLRVLGRSVSQGGSDEESQSRHSRVAGNGHRLRACFLAREPRGRTGRHEAQGRRSQGPDDDARPAASAGAANHQSGVPGRDGRHHQAGDPARQDVLRRRDHRPERQEASRQRQRGRLADVGPLGASAGEQQLDHDQVTSDPLSRTPSGVRDSAYRSGAALILW